MFAATGETDLDLEKPRKSTDTESAMPQQASRATPRSSHSAIRINMSHSVASSPFPSRLRTKDNDVAEQVELEHEDNSHGSRPSSLYLTETKNLVSFANGDPGNPYNWSSTYKAFIVFLGILQVENSTIGSSLPSENIVQIAQRFGVSNDIQLVLPISMFLVGYILGPLLFGPLSESYGRQIVMFATFSGFSIFSLALPFSPNYASFIVFRLLTGIFAASPISVTGGIYADLYDQHIPRGRSMAAFMTATTFGPIAGPIISGYLGPYGWRWPFWCALILVGITWIPLAFLPETYGPTILQRRARKLRRSNPGVHIVAPIELEKSGFREVATVVLTRPVRMFFMEAMVLSSCLYLSLIYAVLFMFFQAYPIIFGDTYGFSPGQQGLAFIPNGIGALVACAIYLWWDHYLLAAKARNLAWANKEEYRRLPLACIAGPLFTIGLFWIAWTSRPSVHWIVPMLGGLPFGTGFLLLFMALINYLVDAYEVFAASAVAAASCSRSVFAALLPFAAVPMFRSLGVAWACSLLGFLSLLMCLIPFAFIRYGDNLRDRSQFCRQLAEKKRKILDEAEAQRLRKERRSQQSEVRTQKEEEV